MDRSQAVRLGNYLRSARHRLGIGTHLLAQRCGVPQPQIHRLEHGDIRKPNPDQLRDLATVLDLDPSEVLSRAGYMLATDMLAPATYLRTKYRDLPRAELDALQRDVSAVLERHGISPTDGPGPGEDEEPTPTSTRKTTTKKRGGSP